MKMGNVKIKLKAMLILAVILFTLIPMNVFAQSSAQFSEGQKSYILDGRSIQMDAAAFTQNGRFFVPIRYLAAAIGLSDEEVKWIPESQTVSLFRNDITVNLILNNKTVFINGQPIQSDVAPCMVNGRVFLPARIITEAFGCAINYDANIRTLSIENSTADSRRELTTKELVEKIQPSVVQVETQRGLGSGFFVSSDGSILTNAHVVRGSSEITITTSDNKRYNAEIYAINNIFDLALLKIEGAGNSFPYIEYYNYLSSVSIGDEIIVFGNPLGLTSTVTKGIVSAIREMEISDAWLPSFDVIQYDATTAPGSSGGPVVNTYGEFIGIHFAGYGTVDFNFAIPSMIYEVFDKTKHEYTEEDDFLCYFTESWSWHEQFKEISMEMSKYQNYSQIVVHIQNTILPNLYDLKNNADSYVPKFKKIDNLKQDFINLLDSAIKFHELYMTGGNRSALEKAMEANFNDYNNYFDKFNAYDAEYSK